MLLVFAGASNSGRTQLLPAMCWSLSFTPN